MQAEDVEVDDELEDLIDPDYEAVASHVEVVVVEMLEDALLDCVSFSQVGYDKPCSIVGNKAHEDTDPNAG